MTVIDAHQHFWQLSRPFRYDWLGTPPMAPICRDFLPDDLEPLIRAAGVDRTIFVQTQHMVEENRWVLELADRYPWIAGVVGWIDLASPMCADQLAEFRAHPKFVGVRHVVQDEPDDDFIIRPAILDGLRVLAKHGIPYDLLFYVKHLKHAAEVARQVPDLPLVIDHLAKPRIKDQSFDDWKPSFLAAAKCETMHCKLSGMITEAAWRRWTVADLKPYVETAIEAFGPKRLMFGSDWPVCELSGTYAEVIAAVRELTSQLSPSEQADIFGGTAARFYRLPENAPAAS